MNEEKVYALFLEAPDVSFLSIQYASSLEEAFTMARIEFARTTTALNDGKKSMVMT